MSTSSPSPSRKRKREDVRIDELEVDVNAPEPPSKKALRKAKRNQQASTVPTSNARDTASAPEHQDDQQLVDQFIKRSDYGIWIGNLPWSASPTDLRTFLTSNTNITDAMITRINMPPPKENATTSRIKPQNKGFAYVDFSTRAAFNDAIALSESLLTGRRVLIKDSRSFEGRPEKPKEESEIATSKSGKPPSNRIFVGNLDFDTTKEDLQEHYSQCGEVLHVHLATFQDSGKCKGYGWVEFDSVEAGQAAVRGWVEIPQKKDQTDSDGDEEEESKKSRIRRKPKLRKWWVNKMRGRTLRMEFAEGKDVRYKKRFGKGAISRGEAPAAVEEKANGDHVPVDALINEYSMAVPTAGFRRSKSRAAESGTAVKQDARKIKPGAALAAAPRVQGGIVASQGKKTVLA